MIKEKLIKLKYPGKASIVQLYKTNENYVVQINVFRNGADATVDDFMALVPFETLHSARELFDTIDGEESAWEIVQKWSSNQ